MKFTELLEKLNIDYRATGNEHCRPGWIQLDCPDCSPNMKRFRLGYNIFGGYCNCWSCGRKQTSSVLAAISGTPYQAVKPLLADLSKELIAEPLVVRGKLEEPKGATPNLQMAHRNYLKRRGFDPKELKRLWGIMGIGHSLTLGWRIYIPIHYKNEIVSWTTRTISDEHKLRYISASAHQEKYNHKDLLYGEDYARHAIVICEGPFDVWKIGPGAVCTFGTGFSRSQLEKMAKYPVRIICYDTDKPGRIRAQKLMDLLSPFDGETFDLTFSSKDAGSAPADELNEIRNRFFTLNLRK